MGMEIIWSGCDAGVVDWVDVGFAWFGFAKL